VSGTTIYIVKKDGKIMYRCLLEDDAIQVAMNLIGLKKRSENVTISVIPPTRK